MIDDGARLKATILEVVENQLRDGDPPETRETIERLIDEGFSEEDARMVLGQAVTVEVYCV